jgi:folate-binding protein YgfZ
VSGADRSSFLQGILTNDVAVLSPGTGCYAAYLTPQGRMITDLRVLVRDDEVILDVPPPVRESLARRLDRLVFTEDVRVEDLSSWSSVTVTGGAAAGALAAVLPLTAAALGALQAGPEYGHVSTVRDGEPIVLVSSRDLSPRRTPPGPLPAIDVCGPAAAVAAIDQVLSDAGARRVAVDEAEALRIEAQRPAFGVDMDEQTIPLEAGIEDRAISTTKGCYVGQEVIVRVLHRGHGRVARKLVAFEVDGGRPGEPVVAAGDPIRAGDHDVGRVTSAAWSPWSGCTIGLGYVSRDAAETFPPLAITHGDTSLAARIRR